MKTGRLHIVVCLTVVLVELIYLIKVLHVFYGDFPFGDYYNYLPATITISTMLIVIIHLSHFIYMRARDKK